MLCSLWQTSWPVDIFNGCSHSKIYQHVWTKWLYTGLYHCRAHFENVWKSVYNVILEHLVDYLSTRQWGFRSSHLCLVISDPWLATLERGQEVRAIFFDNHKAFDSVPHRPLLSNSVEQCYPELANYLTERCLFVNEAKSTPSPVLSGVPHG